MGNFIFISDSPEASADAVGKVIRACEHLQLQYHGELWGELPNRAQA